jgi:DNA-binding NarL/FixJ family response regulator
VADARAVPLGESVSSMAQICCLAGIGAESAPNFSAVFKAAGLSGLATLAQLDVAALGRLAPDLIVCDVDGLDVDALELLRQIRFVLPDCLIVVYTGVMKREWGLSCHLAGANCLLSKDATEAELSEGLRDALKSGCFTDPRFAAA